MAKTKQDACELNAKTELARAQDFRASWEGFWRNVAAIGPIALKYGCIAWACAEAKDVLVAWAGTSTSADVKLSVIADVLGKSETGTLLPWILVGAMFGLYRLERHSKRRALGKLGAVTRKYELLSDPQRSSSRVPRSGKNDPKEIP